LLFGCAAWAAARRVVLTMATTASLLHDANLDLYRCPGCGAEVEGPGYHTDPEARLSWVEQLENKHAACRKDQAVQMGRLVFFPLAWPRGDDGRAAESAAKAPRLAP
jgi:hypothetical protein